jgi:hypothetical protein
MAAIQVKNLNPFLKKTKAQRALIKSSATDFVKKKVTQILKTVLKESPQYSGDFVSNWQVVTSNNPDTGYSTDWYKSLLDAEYRNMNMKDSSQIKAYYDKVRYAGHPEAMQEPMAKGLAVISTIKYNSRVTFINSSPIAGSIKTGDMDPNYRPVHRHLENRAFVDYIVQKYKYNWIK